MLKTHYRYLGRAVFFPVVLEFHFLDALLRHCTFFLFHFNWTSFDLQLISFLPMPTRDNPKRRVFKLHIQIALVCFFNPLELELV